MQRRTVTVDGNEAAANVAYASSEVVAIYPITPASTMGELADAWAAASKRNVFGSLPKVVEMQSEAGAAGALHGALQAGSLATSFTASQGLLLMLPNMFKIAGELTPAVLHVAARSIATHALSIFGDHSDVMAARTTGWAMLSSGSVQEAQDMAAVAHAATLQTRVPFLHFFDGFRTSHEIAKIEELAPEDLLALLDPHKVHEHRMRALNPDRPVLRGSAQNPDVFFQAREAANLFHDAVPGVVDRTLEQFAKLVGRKYATYEQYGSGTAKRVVVLMGSATGAVQEAVDHLMQRGEEVALVQVRLYRPFDVRAFVAALPKTVERIAVLDRTKEPGAPGEPLYQDVVTAIAEGWRGSARPDVIGGRYGLSSKEFTPAMALAVFAELDRRQSLRHFTVGIVDDVTHLSLAFDRETDAEIERARKGEVRCVFYGLGSDGTVGANKNSVKIIGEDTELFAQGYFVYDSRKSGAVTISHLRFSPRPIRSSYLIQRANFVACHQFHFLERMNVLGEADFGATFLLNSPHAASEVWSKLPVETQRQIVDKKLRFFVVDADRVARESGLGGRINTVMQTCFFALSGVLPKDEAIARIKKSIEKSYGGRGRGLLDKNFAAVDASLGGLAEVQFGDQALGDLHRQSAFTPARGDDVDAFLERVTARILAGEGDLLPVSALPVDGTFPTGTSRYEKRGIAREIPIWDADLCIQCGLCPLVCPHAAIRMKPYREMELAQAPASFKSRPWSGKEFAGQNMTIQVAPDDCTGCGICVEVCPARSKSVAKHKAIDMQPRLEHLERERANFAFFLQLPEVERASVETATVKGSQALEPLFEYSGACAGCGETPYLKLLSQLYGDRIVVANATGCSSIFGGNLPTTPWAKDKQGRGPAWANSLFEDNAEFGYGIRLALDHQATRARELLGALSSQLPAALVSALFDADQHGDKGIAAQRTAIADLKHRCVRIGTPAALELLRLCDHFVERQVWIVGGDGWAYDIGFGGLDHVLASDRDVNILVLDTGVYSNTGGQASKATPRGAVAKFAAGGKQLRRKDLGLLATSYGHVYVAQIALGAHPRQTIEVFHEAASYKGPSLILAYSHCIAHGIEMSTSMGHQRDATNSGFWPLFRFDPRRARAGQHPFQLDSKKPRIPFKDFAVQEGRFASLQHSDPKASVELLALAQSDIDEQWRLYEQMAGIDRGSKEETS